MGFKLPKIGKIFSSTAGTKPHAMSIAKAQSPKPAQGNVSGSKSPFHVTATKKDYDSGYGKKGETFREYKNRTISNGKYTKPSFPKAENKDGKPTGRSSATGSTAKRRTEPTGTKKIETKKRIKANNNSTSKSNTKVSRQSDEEIAKKIGENKVKMEKTTPTEVKKDTRTAGQKRADRKKQKQDMKASGASRKERRLAKSKDKAKETSEKLKTADKGSKRAERLKSIKRRQENRANRLAKRRNKKGGDDGSGKSAIDKIDTKISTSKLDNALNKKNKSKGPAGYASAAQRKAVHASKAEKKAK